MTLKLANLIENNSLIFFVNPDGAVAEMEVRTIDIEDIEEDEEV